MLLILAGHYGPTRVDIAVKQPIHGVLHPVFVRAISALLYPAGDDDQARQQDNCSCQQPNERFKNENEVIENHDGDRDMT